MANFVDLKNRLVAEFGEERRTEIVERLNLARSAKHLPPARSRGGRKAADLTSLDCAVAILALVSSDRAVDTAKRLKKLRELRGTSFTMRLLHGPLCELGVRQSRLELALYREILVRRGEIKPREVDVSDLSPELQAVFSADWGAPAKSTIAVSLDPLPPGAVLRREWVNAPSGYSHWESQELTSHEGNLVLFMEEKFGEDIPATGLWLGSVRVVTGGILDVMADLLGPLEGEPT